jgi:hypothetical protein
MKKQKLMLRFLFVLKTGTMADRRKVVEKVVY